MDSLAIPPSIPKAVAPFLARAKELNAKDKVISYWCKFKAAQVAMDAGLPSDSEGRAFLENLLDDLENAKASLSGNELVTDDAAGSAYISNFATRVFESADRADRDGRATRLTAKEFLASSVFFELLTIFGPLETDVTERTTYAKWKATDIAKAIREGRKPTPGPAAPALPEPEQDQEIEGDALPDVYGEPGHTTSSEDVARQLTGGNFSPPPTSQSGMNDNYDDFSLPSAPMDGDFPSARDLSPTSPFLPSAPAYEPASKRTQPPPPASATAPSRPPPPSAPVVEEEWKPEPANVDPTTISNAQKHAKFAISALNYDDLDTARKELRLALQLIGG